MQPLISPISHLLFCIIPQLIVGHRESSPWVITPLEYLLMGHGDIQRSTLLRQEYNVPLQERIPERSTALFKQSRKRVPASCTLERSHRPSVGQ